MEKVIVAITGLVVLDSVALLCGVNGVLFTFVVVAIAGLGGYELRSLVIKNE